MGILEVHRFTDTDPAPSLIEIHAQVQDHVDVEHWDTDPGVVMHWREAGTNYWIISKIHNCPDLSKFLPMIAEMIKEVVGAQENFLTPPTALSTVFEAYDLDEKTRERTGDEIKMILTVNPEELLMSRTMRSDSSHKWELLAMENSEEVDGKMYDSLDEVRELFKEDEVDLSGLDNADYS